MLVYHNQTVFACIWLTNTRNAYGGKESRLICALAVRYFIFVQCNQNDKDGVLALFHHDICIFAEASAFVRVSFVRCCSLVGRHCVYNAAIEYKQSTVEWRKKNGTIKHLVEWFFSFASLAPSSSAVGIWTHSTILVGIIWRNRVKSPP